MSRGHGGNRSIFSRKLIQVILLQFALLLCLGGCDLFQYSPYEADPGANQRDQTAIQLKEIAAQATVVPRACRFAVIGDSHDWYGSLDAVVNRINADTTLDFVIHVGDLTSSGLLTQYRWTYEILAELTVPILTVIGNHDCQSNGVTVYRRMFGELDYAWTYGRTRFVMLNTNGWEFESGVPNLGWLESQLTLRDAFDHLIVVAHVPPFGDEMRETGHEDAYQELLTEYNVSLSVHGHQHVSYIGQPYHDSITYLVADDVVDSNYFVVTIDGTSIAAELVDLRTTP